MSDNDINKNLLSCQPLDRHMPEMHIFQKVDDFYSEMGLQKKDYVGVYIYRAAAAMTAHTADFHSRVRT